MLGPPLLAFVTSHCLPNVTETRLSKKLEIKLQYVFCGNYVKT